MTDITHDADGNVPIGTALAWARLAADLAVEHGPGQVRVRDVTSEAELKLGQRTYRLEHYSNPDAIVPTAPSDSYAGVERIAVCHPDDLDATTRAVAVANAQSAGGLAAMVAGMTEPGYVFDEDVGTVKPTAVPVAEPTPVLAVIAHPDATPGQVETITLADAREVGLVDDRTARTLTVVPTPAAEQLHAPPGNDMGI